MYRTIVLFYHLLVRLFSLWNPNAPRWIKGREGSRGRHRRDLFSGRNQARSLVPLRLPGGNPSRGRPLIEGLRQTHPPAPASSLTFFSPSGLEVSRNYPGADYILYLPMDSPQAARRFLDAVKPALAVFIKYEFWHYYPRRTP